MDARLRTYLLVALAAAGTAGLVVVTVAFTRTSPRAVAQTTTPTSGRAPALVLDLGLRSDPEAVALRRANRLYSVGRRRAAARIFVRYRSVDAQVGAAVAAWPNNTLPRLDELATRHPSSGVVLLHLGLAQVASGNAKGAEAAWRKALARDPDSEAAVEAESLLHPRFAPGRPPFVPSFGVPAAVARLSPARQLAALERAARSRSVEAKLLYGSALQRLGRPVSAEEQFAVAARLAPGNPEARTAAAVGLFSKARPALAFSRLGPLAARFPRSQSVRFHLGELLLWIGQLDKARQELQLARSEGRTTPLGRTAAEFLAKLPR
ncbi:MAG TPA: tetratricopeptide repeat protein [Gaiellaceae bacterium]|nr:tetratricopeptide repeat protein [Gaiellaceae bacterium]